jgi:hypothetical protein
LGCKSAPIASPRTECQYLRHALPRDMAPSEPAEHTDDFGFG